MVCRSIDFALVVPKLLIFKVCVIIGISKIEFFDFFGIERANENAYCSKTHSNNCLSVFNHFVGLAFKGLKTGTINVIERISVIFGKFF